MSSECLIDSFIHHNCRFLINKNVFVFTNRHGRLFLYEEHAL